MTVRLGLAVAALLLTACASTPTAWERFSRAETTAATRDFDWQACHDRYINPTSYPGINWMPAVLAKHEPDIRACMVAKGYARTGATP